MADRKLKKNQILEDGNDQTRRRVTRSANDRVDDWLEEQYEMHQNSSPNTDSKYDEDSNIDQDDPSEQDDSSVIDGGRRKPAFQYSKEMYDTKCEWFECDYESTNVDNFVSHVGSHLPQMDQRESDVFYCCLWDSCGFDSKDVNTVIRHINYHSYHTKIKAIGNIIIKRCNLPNCTLDYAGRNLLPVLPPRLNCEWNDCDFESLNFQLYLYHVHCHVHSLPTREHPKSDVKVLCEWRGCKKTFSNSHKLRDHVRSHTQEKMVGCPVCGTQFSNKTKFYDHCKRQMPNEKKCFKCSHCRKNFASERTLRDHFRLHVNSFKCPSCDMTCPFQSTLVLHIRYRHLDLKPFQCSFCEHRSKTQRDLENHQLTHCSENFWVCEQEDCDYSCRSKFVLQEHYAKNHSENVDLCQYCCHICPKKYKRGADLTTHLKNQHSYRWASGHSRFKYIRGDDGNYSLQTVRYESIEVTQEMMKTKTKEIPPVSDKKYRTKMESGNLIIEEATEEQKQKQEFTNMSFEVQDLDISADLTVEESYEETNAIFNMEENCNLIPPSNDNLPSEENEDSDSDSFGESLKKYLGLTGTSSFIKVIKTNPEKH